MGRAIHHWGKITHVQYLQNVVFSFENSSSGQNTPCQIRTTCLKIPPGELNATYPLTLFEKPWRRDQVR